MQILTSTQLEAMKTTRAVLLCCCFLFCHALAIGSIPFIGITGSGKTTTSNMLTGCGGATGGTANAVTDKAVIHDAGACSGLQQNFQIIDTAGFMHHSKEKIIRNDVEISGKTFSLLSLAEGLQLNPDIIAISIVHACSRRLDSDYRESLAHVVDLASPVPIPFHITFTQCADPHCLQCREDFQHNLGLWNEVLGCMGGHCGFSDPNSIMGRPRLIGATFVEHEGCPDGNEVSCISAHKLRQEFAKWTAPLTPVRIQIPNDYEQKILAGDLPTTKRHAKDQYCSSCITSYEAMAQCNAATIARLNELRLQQQETMSAPLIPFWHTLQDSCPVYDPKVCVRTTRHCGNRRYGVCGPRSCHDEREFDPVCLKNQNHATETCHAQYHQNVQIHNQWIQAQRNEILENFNSRINSDEQEYLRVLGLMEQMRPQYDFCKYSN